jgi:two-component system chemotaxis response regulator CheY
MLKDAQVLIVDDYHNMLHIIRSCLKQIEITDVREATDGQAAFKMINQCKFDLVISDWNMEPMSGLELLAAVRRHPYCKTLPFILVTATNDQSQIERAVRAGVSDYIIKPFSADTINRKVRSLLGY